MPVAYRIGEHLYLSPRAIVATTGGTFSSSWHHGWLGGGNLTKEPSRDLLQSLSDPEAQIHERPGGLLIEVVQLHEFGHP